MEHQPVFSVRAPKQSGPVWGQRSGPEEGSRRSKVQKPDAECQELEKNQVIEFRNLSFFPLQAEKFAHLPVGGRTKLFVQNWHCLTSDPWILDTIQGLKLDFCQTPPIQLQAPQLSFDSQKTVMISQEVQSLLEKKGYMRDKQRTGVLFKSPVLSGEKGWRSEACCKSEKSQYLSDLQSFQDGGDSLRKRSHSKIRLDDKIRPDRRVSDNSLSQRVSKISSVQMGREDLSVPVTPLWNFGSSPSVYKYTEGSNKFSETNRYVSSNLLGRYTYNESVLRKLSVRCTDHYETVKELRFSDKHEKISHNSNSANDFSGLHNRLCRNAPVFTKSENPKNQENLYQGQIFKNSHCTEISRIVRQSNCHNPSSFSSPTPLQEFTDFEKQRSSSQFQLQYNNKSFKRGSGRDQLVDSPSKSLEWQSSVVQSAITYHPDRCKQLGLGSYPGSNTHRASMVTVGKTLSHKCFRTVGCNTCSEIFPEGQTEHSSSNSDRQDYINLHQQDGWDSIQNLQPAISKPLDMVSAEEHNNQSRLHSGSRESSSRLVVETSLRLQQLDASPENIQNINDKNKGLQHRSICRSLKCTDQNLHELASRSRCHSFQCSSSSVDTIQGVCISPNSV